MLPTKAWLIRLKRALKSALPVKDSYLLLVTKKFVRLAKLFGSWIKNSSVASFVRSLAKRSGCATAHDTPSKSVKKSTAGDYP